ncbi:MAG TPA: response regulator [Polyangiaceae bacterium]|nr:response regulator [Polyangiaceae bacterium]
MSCVLIVEDDTITRSLLARVVGTIPGISALAVGSVQEARAALEVARPDVAIIDLHLEDGLGFDVLKAIDEKGGVSLAIIISAYLDEHQRALSATPGRLRCMAKPIDYGELKRTLTSLPSAGPRFHGPFAPVEYVQIAGSGRHSVMLSCHDPAGAFVGNILIRDGRVWSAQTARASGLPALRELVTRPDARVRLEAPSEPSPAANIGRDWQVAVLDALAPDRASDEPSSDDFVGTDVSDSSDSLGMRDQLDRLYQFQRSVKH